MPPDGVLDQVLADFTSAASRYYPQLSIAAASILSAVIFLQVCYLAIQAARRWNFSAFAETWLFGLVSIAVVQVVLGNLWEWGNDFITASKEIALNVTGVSPDSYTPSQLFDAGKTIINQIYQMRSWGMYLHPINDLELIVILGVAFVAFAAVAIIYLWTLIESLYHIVIGPLVVCWSALDMFHPSMLRWAEQLLGLTVKLTATLLLVTIGGTIMGVWGYYINSIGVAVNAHRIYYSLVTLVEAVAFLAGMWILPRKAMAGMGVGAGGGSAGDDAARSMMAAARGAASAAINAGTGAVVGGISGGVAGAAGGPAGIAAGAAVGAVGGAITGATTGGGVMLGRYIQSRLRE